MADAPPTQQPEGEHSHARGWVTRGIMGIVLATFFSDVGHEMATAVLPLYLISVGLGPAALGVMEGLADLGLSIAKLAGGVAGHRISRKRDVTATGYAVTAVCTASMGLTTTAFGVGSLRIAAWLGRGFRGPLRDFLLADEVKSSHYGRAYGFERAADMLGAVLGPGLALLLLALGAPLFAIIAVSVVPSLLAAASILSFTSDRQANAEPPPLQSAARRLPRRFWLLLGGVLLFGLGDFSRTFLIFLAASALGPHAGHAAGSIPQQALSAGVVAYAAHNVVSGLTAFPVGKLGDKLPKGRLLAAGYALGAATNLLLASSSSLGAVSVAILGSGVYIAVEETLEKASVAELLPRSERSLGLGILAGANALGDMVSSFYVGGLLAAGKGSWAFGIAATFGALGCGWVYWLMRQPRAAAT